MRVFLSYASRQRDLAHRLALSLQGEGHDVFFDRSSLQEGGEYDAAIRRAIEECDLFVFLISRDSIAPGSYALAELVLAEKQWRHPGGHVLPILTEPVPMADVPPYLRAVSILQPSGDFVAEASAAVARLNRKKPKTVLLAALAVAVLVLVASSWFAYSRLQEDRAQQEEVRQALAAAELDVSSGRYDNAFRSLGAALTQHPGDKQLELARNDSAMRWLRNIRVSGGQTYTDVVNIVRPALSDSAAASNGAEAADLLAHLGWAEFLLDRNSGSGNPIPYFQQAVAIDAANPFAQAMWGFWILYRHGPLSEATEHFNKGAGSGRETAWVRNWQLTALHFYHDEELELEAIRVANGMRKAELKVTAPERFWSVYTSHLMTSRESARFLAALSGSDHLATFVWLFPENAVDESRANVYKLLLGRMHEAAGDRERALAAYRAIESEMKRNGSSGSLLDRTIEGIRRLEGASR